MMDAASRARSLSYDDSFARRHGTAGIRESPSLPAAQESETSSNSSPERQVLGRPVIRTNFGKRGGYVPPQVTKSYVPKPVEEAARDDDSVPFDQKANSRPYVPNISSRPRQKTPTKLRIKLVQDVDDDSSRPFDESFHGGTDDEETSSLSLPKQGAPVAVVKSFTPPRRSSPERSPSARRSALEKRYKMTPPRISAPVLLQEESSTVGETTTDASLDVHANTPARANELSYEEFGMPRDPRESVEEDDSLFDFEENEKRRRRGKAWRLVDEETDESTLPPTSLQERAQAAWKRKQRAKSVPQVPVPPQASSHAVSFGKSDTVHHFEPDLDETLDSATFAGRSINSEYTKSAESEVEDLIKDIFMIGNAKATTPGRRKIKYNPRVKDQLQRDGDSRTMEDDDDEDEEEVETLETNEEEEPSLESPSSPRGKKTYTTRIRATDTSQSEDVTIEIDEKKEDDILAGVWTSIEGGISAVGVALGLDSKGAPETEKKSASPTKSTGTTKKAICGKEDATADCKSFWEYASDVLLGGTPGTCQKRDNVVAPEEEEVVQTAPSLEEDMRLVDLAIEAARSMHKLQGYVFDETYEINIVSDIKFSVVDIRMPLGLIFQENHVGCWVTKVMHGGNASLTRQVQVGDQLAAIDGVSAINMKVDEVAAMVKRKSKGVELTFLRYIGPLRPEAGTVEEEGYEVKATARNDLRLLGGLRPVSNKPTMIEKTAAVSKSSPALLSTSATRGTSMKVVEPVPQKEKRKFRLFGRRNR